MEVPALPTAVSGVEVLSAFSSTAMMMGLNESSLFESSAWNALRTGSRLLAIKAA
jgi:hypothetical protein